MNVRRGAAAKKKPKVVEKVETVQTQRQHQRLAVNLLIDYQVLDQFLYDYATNISLGGVFIRSSNPLPVGTKLRVQFSLPGLKDMVTTWGEVAHVVEDRAKQGFAGMGIRFSDLDASQKRMIDKLMNASAIEVA
jgi:type IV pilus assembly protein PilZ